MTLVPLPLNINSSASLSPPAVLTALATIAKVPEPTDLSTVVIPEHAKQIYTAILDYTSLSPNDSHPSDVIKNAHAVHGLNTLYISPADPVEDRHVLSDDEDDDGDDEDGTLKQRGSYFHSRSMEAYLRAKLSKKDKPAIVPRLTYGFGATAITWPPPPHLEAEYLFRKRTSKHPIDTSPSSITTTTPCPSSTIYVCHYTVGQPVKTCNGPSILHAITIASTSSSDTVLRRFTTSVTEWKRQKDRPPTRRSCYALFRLKTLHDEVWWSFEGLRRSRPVSSLILPAALYPSLSADVARFLSPRGVKWYHGHGLPHRRAFLFEGPPGSGKTSTIRVLAAEFHLACCFMTLTDAKFSNQVLCDAFSKMPRRALLVLEDVDALFDEKRRARGGEKIASLTFSGLLNALDGVMSADHVVTILTTNHPERLDAAMLRGGRVDRRFYFGYPEEGEIEELFRRFYPEAEGRLCKEFAQKVLKREEKMARSIATLQQFFIMYRDVEAEECVKEVDKFFAAHYQEGGGQEEAGKGEKGKGDKDGWNENGVKSEEEKVEDGDDDKKENETDFDSRAVGVTQ